MPTTTMTPTERRLFAEIAELRAELERRDIEQCEIEGAIEFLDRQRSTHLYVLAELTGSTIGISDNSHGRSSTRSSTPSRSATRHTFKAPKCSSFGHLAARRGSGPGPS